MKHFKLLGLIVTAALLSAFTVSNNAVSWNIEQDHSIQFNTKKVKGEFKTFSGDIQFDNNNLDNSYFDVIIDVNSIKTGNFLKNKHAKGKDWFNTKEFPTINFSSKSIKKSASGYMVNGTLEMRGVQKEIEIPFTFSDNVFKGSLTVNRTDYAIGKTTGMSKKVGHEITIDIAVPVTQ